MSKRTVVEALGDSSPEEDPAASCRRQRKWSDGLSADVVFQIETILSSPKLTPAAASAAAAASSSPPPNASPPTATKGTSLTNGAQRSTPAVLDALSPPPMGDIISVDPCWTGVMTPELISSGVAPFLPIERYNRGLFALGVVGGRDVAKLIRHENLIGNDTFLLHCASISIWESRSEAVGKAKMLAWMEVNTKWEDRCQEELKYSSIVGIESNEDFTNIDLVDLPSGGAVYQGGASEAENSPNLGDFLVGYEKEWIDVGDISTLCHEYRFVPLRGKIESFYSLFDGNRTISLIFASDANYVLNDPRIACRFGIKELLAKALNGKKAEDEALCYDVFGRVIHRSNPDAECFKYLLTLPGIKSQARRILDRLLEYCHIVSLDFLRSFLEENIVDVNETDLCGQTVLHEAIYSFQFHHGSDFPGVNHHVLPKIKMLLEFSANPHIADNDGDRPIDILLSRISFFPGLTKYSSFKEMVALLEGGRNTA